MQLVVTRALSLGRQFAVTSIPTFPPFFPNPSKNRADYVDALDLVNLGATIKP
jgi:hypothetical protein